MTSIQAAFFCEKVYVMVDGRHMTAGILPGVLAYTGAPQPIVALDAYALIKFDTPGTRNLDISIATLSGSTIARNSLSVSVADARFGSHLAIGNVQLPLRDGETYILSCKEQGEEWKTACRLDMFVKFVEDARPVLS